MARCLRAAMAFALLLTGFGGLSVFAQTTTGRITGTVGDVSGAMIPGVEVVIRNPATGLTRTILTNETGTYMAAALPPAPGYEVEASLPGFRREVRSGITLAMEAVIRIDFILEVGAVTEVIEVTAEAPLVESDTAVLGQVMGGKTISELPLNQRHFMSLTHLTTGVLPDVQGGARQSPSFYANGVDRRNNDFLLDGVDNNDTGNTQLVIIPSIDAIQEFKLSTSTYGAELGRASGGVLNIQTKSGSNEFHLVLFEFLRNDKLDARNFFASEKQPYKRNQFGAVVSGPIMKDKMFFMFNYEGNRVRNTETALRVVPTALERAGDFSKSSFKSGFSAIMDPLTGLPFPGNIIPADRIDSISNGVASFYPLPNRPGQQQNYEANSTRITDFDLYNGKWDWRVSDRQNIFFRGTWQDVFEIQTNFDRGALPMGGSTFFQPIGRNFALSDTYVFSPTVVNEARIGFNRLIGGIYDETYGTDHAKALGVTGVQSAFVPDERRFGWPRMTVSGYAPVGSPSFSAQLRFDNVWHMSDMLSVTRGNHQLKIGGEARTFMINIFIDSSPNGNFRFDGRYTGHSFGDVLMGFPNRSSRKVGDPYTHSRSRAYGLFIQDDWKVTPNLTLNLGVRWEAQTRAINVLKDEGRGMAVFHIPTKQIVIGGEDGPRQFKDPVTGEPNAITIEGGAQFGYPEGLYNNDLNNFVPRFGFAWSPEALDLVVRGGYGIFTEPEIAAETHGNRDGSYPWVLPQTFNGSRNSPPTLSLADPINTVFPVALGSGSITSRASDVNQRDGYVQQWQLSLQRPLGGSMVMEVAYVGSKGTKLDNTTPNRNQARLGPGSISSRRPIPEFGNISYNERSGLSTYHSLQTKLERRFASGLAFVSAWTWSHAIGCCNRDRDTRDPDNLHLEKAQTSFDIRHRMVNSFSYELPWGAGKPFLSNLSGAANALLGGWQVAGIATFTTGQSFTPGWGEDVANVGQSTTRPNRICDGVLPRGERSADRWFDTSCFTRPADGTNGDSGYNVLKAPGQVNWDLTVTKNTLIGERQRVEFRVEFFNAFNQAHFFVPNSRVNSSAFGRSTQTHPARQIQFGLKYYY